MLTNKLVMDDITGTGANDNHAYAYFLVSAHTPAGFFHQTHEKRSGGLVHIVYRVYLIDISGNTYQKASRTALLGVRGQLT